MPRNTTKPATNRTMLPPVYFLLRGLRAALTRLMPFLIGAAFFAGRPFFFGAPFCFLPAGFFACAELFGAAPFPGAFFGDAGVFGSPRSCSRIPGFSSVD